jgi:hypothetical protein
MVGGHHHSEAAAKAGLPNVVQGCIGADGKYFDLAVLIYRGSKMRDAAGQPGPLTP